MKVARLADIADILMGTAPSGDSYNQSAIGYPLVAGASDFGIDHPRAKKFTSEPTILSQNGDIIMGIRATIGNLNWSDGTYCLGRGVAGIRVKEKIADPKYVFFSLKNQAGYLNRLGTGSTFTQIRRNDIEKCPIPLPPLPIQKKISAILEKANQARRKVQEALRFTDEFLQSAFLQMFGDPVKNTKGWEIKSIDELCFKVTDGVHKTPTYLSTGIPFISVNNVSQGIISLTSAKFISEKDHIALIKRCNPEKGDVLLSKVGTVGVAVVIETEKPFSIFVQLALLKPKKELIYSKYLEFILNSKSIRHRILSGLAGATMKYIGIGDIKKIKIPLPPLDAQKQFIDIVRQTKALHEKQQKNEQNLEKLFQSLMQKSFKGELVV
ncbi:MAG: restriction endonuclease subunit S [Nitrospiria bacterium]